MSLLMDALKKAESDKQKQGQEGDQAEISTASVDHEPADSLSLELTHHPDEFDDLPESDVVDEPRPGVETQAGPTLELEQPAADSPQPTSTAAAGLARSRKHRNRLRLYRVAATMLIVSMAIAGYFFWQMHNLNKPISYTRAAPVQPTVPSPEAAAVPPQRAVATPTENTPEAVTEIKRAEPIVQESFLPPAADPEVTEKPIKLKRHTANRKVTQQLNGAYQAYRSGDYRQAATLYETVLRRLPRNRDAMLGLAAIALEHGNTAGARRYYQQILELNPADPVARTALLDLKGQEDLAGDTSRIKHWLQTNSEDAALQFVLGNRYARAEQWSKAQQAYFRAHEISPDNADYAYNLAISLEQLNKPQLAIEYYRIAQHNASIQKANFDPQIVSQRLQVLQSIHAGTDS